MRGIISSAHVNKESNIQKVEYEAQVKLPIPAASTDRLTARLRKKMSVLFRTEIDTIEAHLITGLVESSSRTI